MDELMLLRKMVEEHDYHGAIAIIDELDEMAKDDKIIKVEAYMRILLIHLIKQHAENHTTRSWDNSVDSSLFGIVRSNKRKKAGGTYLNDEELVEAINEIFTRSLRDASLEAFGGAYSDKQLAEMIDADEIKKEALDKILTYKL